jgi:hypothetical protein
MINDNNGSFVRDENSQAVLATDSQSLNKYKKERRFYRTVSKLESDVHEIQKTLSDMCERITKLENK